MGHTLLTGHPPLHRLCADGTHACCHGALGLRGACAGPDTRPPGGGRPECTQNLGQPPSGRGGG